MKPPTSIAWENGPTGGASSGEVIAVRRIWVSRGIRISAKHEFPQILMQDNKFHKFIIITIIIPWQHYSVRHRQNALGAPLARRFACPRRIRRCRVHRRCSQSSIPDAFCDYPASAKAGGCIGCRAARPLGKTAASELARIQGARTGARSTAADGGAEISYVE